MEQEILRTEKQVKELENKLNDLMAAFIASLVTINGRLSPTSGNLSKVSQIDGIYRTFNEKYQSKVLANLMQMLEKRDVIIRKYFASIGLKADRSAQVTGLINNMKSYMNDFSKGDILIMDLKRLVNSAIVSGADPSAFIKALSESTKGELAKYYNRYMYNTLMQFERVNNLFYADKFKLNWFYYRGGLIQTSRVFCIEKNNKLFNRKDAAAWEFDPNLPAAGDGLYEPLVDLGRWNCRHYLQWVTDEQANE